MNLPVIKIVTYVLDDQELVLRTIEKAFESYGIKDYQLFSDAAEFLDAINDDVHIAVIDYLLSSHEMTGLEVCRMLLEKNPRCYVIIMSGQSDMDVVIDFMNSGAWRYVRKYERNYQAKVIEFINEATRLIKEDLEFYTTLVNKYNEIGGKDEWKSQS